MLHQIGIGTLGPVFRTYEPSRDRLVAVKVFRLDIVPEQSQALADALGRAVQASLFHPSIVEPIAAGVEGTVAYRAEEYVAAESLDVAMRHYAPAAIDKVLPFITQLAGAIDFARAAGVGHGGLHPRDIFVTPDEARATGFGVVEALEQVGVRAPVRRPYTAPERIEGRPWSTPADIFSLAAITFELLTGRRPAGTGTQIGALPDGDQADAMQTVLARAMDDDPARRFGSALAFAAALDSASRGEGESSTVSDVAAIAAVAPAPPAPVPPTPQAPERTSTPPAAVRRTEAPMAPTPGEFEIERRLEPPAALEKAADATSAPAAEAKIAAVPAPANVAPTLFESEGPEEPVEPSHDEPRPFADEFVEDDHPLDLVPEQRAAADDRRPLEPFEPEPEEADIQESEPPYSAEETVSPRDLSIPPDESALGVPDEDHSSVLPTTLVALLCLLIGFGLGYFVGGQHQAAPPQAAAAAPAAAPPGASAPVAEAHPDQPISQPPAPQTAAGTGGAPSSATAAPPVEAPPPVSEAPLGASAASAGRPSTTPRAPARPAAPAPSTSEHAARRGRLIVRSVPEHAGVVVNGTWRGRTPLTLDDLPFGRYVVRIVQPGYQVAREEFTLSASDAQHTLGARLEKEARGATQEPAAPARTAAAPRSEAPETFTGTLYVDSRPQGATVLLDNRSIGKTPLMLPDVPIGMHVVRIELTGKQPWSSTARVVAGQTVRVTGSLEDK